jgi:hypothetical protein
MRLFYTQHYVSYTHVLLLSVVVAAAVCALMLCIVYIHISN